MSRFFKLVGRDAVPVSSEAYLQWILEDPDHGVRSIQVDLFDSGEDQIRVSTSFLMGINHRWMPDAEPLLFETMVFGGTMDQAQWRYSTWSQAEAGHKEVVDQLLREMPNLVRVVQPEPEPQVPRPTRYERIIRHLCPSLKN